jgi:endoglucanase
VIRSWQSGIRQWALWLAIAVALPGAAARAQSKPAACVDVRPGVPAQTLKSLSRGVNLAGWMDGTGSPAPPAALLRELHLRGMTHVRLPVPAESVMRRFAAEGDLQRQLHAVDQALSTLTSIGFHVSVDLHPGNRFTALHRGNAEASRIALRDAWANLASVIRKHPADAVLAELLNEPDVEAPRWQSEVVDLAGFVRALLPHTTLVVGPTNSQRADSLPAFQPLNDLNVVYAIHFYDPMVFTHQGHWDPQEPLSRIRGLPYPVDASDPAVQALRRRLQTEGQQRALDELDRAIDQAGKGDVVDMGLEAAVAWQKQFARPLIINEFGVLKAEAPPESRARWLKSVVDFSERHCWGWAHWELAQGFGILDDKSGKPDPTVMRALLGGL